MLKTVRKEFIADSESRAILEAKIEFGEDFDILKKEPTEYGGIMGLFTKKGIKLVVQSPKRKNIRNRVSSHIKKNREKNRSESSSINRNIRNNNESDRDDLHNMKKFLSSIQQKNNLYKQSEEDTEILKKIFSNPIINPLAKKSPLNSINTNINNKTFGKLKPSINNTVSVNNNKNQSIEKLSDEIKRIKESIMVLKTNSSSNENTSNNKNEYYKKMIDILIENDFPEELAERVMVKFESTLNEIQKSDKDIYLKKFKEFLIDHIYTRNGITCNKNKKITLVGPTGNGKTTTIAKLAYHFKYDCEKTVKVISTDCFKFGGIKQLSDICEQMDIDFVPVYDIDSYKNEITDQQVDVILIDTSGKNFNEDKNLSELKDYIEVDKEIEKYLVLSSLSKYNDMMKINSNFSEISMKGIIFTKFDICEYIGSMLAFLIKSKNSLTYITTGKKIDGDLKEVVTYKLIDGLFK